MSRLLMSYNNSRLCGDKGADFDFPPLTRSFGTDWWSAGKSVSSGSRPVRKSTSELGYNRVDGAGRPKFEFHTDRDWGRPRRSPVIITETTAPCFLDQSKSQRARSAPGRSVSLFPEPAPVWKGPYIPARGRRTISPYSRGTRRLIIAWTRCRTTSEKCPTPYQ